MTKTKKIKAWAIATQKGRIFVEDTYASKRTAERKLQDFNEAYGNKNYKVVPVNLTYSYGKK